MVQIVRKIRSLLRKNAGRPGGYTSTRIERAAKPLAELAGPITSLPRGGYLADTDAGYIQFGSPPETIKDTMRLPGGVPDIFVISNDMFDWIDFPMYQYIMVPEAVLGGGNS